MEYREKTHEIIKKGALLVILITNFYFFLVALVIVFYSTANTYDYKADLTQLITGASIVSSGEIQNLYDTTTQKKYQSNIAEVFKNVDGLKAYRSLPFVAIFMSPLSRVDFLSSFRIWALIIIISSLIVLKFFSDSNQDYFGKVLMLFAFYPFALNIHNGQLSFLMAISTGIAFLMLKQDKCFIAGLVTGLILVKPHFLILLPYSFLIAKDRKKFTIGFSISAVVLLLIGLPRMGFYYWDYLKFLLASEGEFYGTNPRLMSSFSNIFSYISPQHFTILNILFFLIANPPALLYFNKNNKHNIPEINYIAITLLVSSMALHSFIYDYIIIFYPMVYLYRKPQYYSVMLIILTLPLLTILQLDVLIPFLTLSLGLYMLKKPSILVES
jgi:hypothetical protein